MRKVYTLWDINNLKKGYPFLVIFGTHISDTTGYQMAAQFPISFSPHVCFCTTWENRMDKMCIKINKKTKNFIFLDM